jgi:hypothetical protein
MRKQLACSVLQKFNVVLIDRIKQKKKSTSLCSENPNCKTNKYN